MPVLRPDTVASEWSFEPIEDLQSRILPQLFVYRLNNMYAQHLHAKGQLVIPDEEGLLNIAFMKQMIYHDAVMDIITTLIRDHTEAVKNMEAQAQSQGQGGFNLDNLQTRAASLVNSQTSNI